VEILAFVKTVTWRLSVAALAKVQVDKTRLRRGMEEAMTFQVLATGPALAGFALIAPWLLPVLFGRTWDPVVDVYPFIALGYMVNAVFNMQSSVLYVLKKNRSVAWFNATHVLLFAATSLLLVPRFGLWGYATAEVVALCSYAVSHWQVTRLLPVSYARVIPWLVGLAPPLFAVFLPMPWALALWLPLALIGLWPPQRAQLGGYIRELRWRAT
jgi:PST family polysaccharide transporter